jgi:hypothetical protein
LATSVVVAARFFLGTNDLAGVNLSRFNHLGGFSRLSTGNAVRFFAAKAATDPDESANRLEDVKAGQEPLTSNR